MRLQNGFRRILYLGPRIWEMLPSKVQEYTTLFEFKRKVKSWNPVNCPCKLYKKNIGGVGYVWMMEQYTPSMNWIGMSGYLTLKIICKVDFG